MTSVHSFGAVGNAISNDYVAITGTIADIETLESGRIRKGDNLEFESNIYLTDSTIHIGKHFGTQIVGKGTVTDSWDIFAGGGPTLDSNFSLVGTVIMGNSLDSGVFNLQGSNIGIRDLSIWGRSGEAVTKSAVGIQITKEVGLATGRNRLYDLGLIDLDTGLRIGNNNTDGSCDLVVCDRLWVQDCNSGVQVMNAESVGHNFQSSYFTDCAVAYDFQAGGKSVIGQVGLEGTDILLNTINQDANTGQIIFGDVFVDAATTGIPRMVNSSSGTPLSVTFGNIHVPKTVAAQSGPIFNLHSGNRVIVQSAQFLKGTLAHFEDGGDLRLENVIFDDYDDITFWQTGSTGDFRFEMVNCYATDDVPIDDVLFVGGTLIESGSATLVSPDTSNITGNNTGSTGTGAGGTTMGSFTIGGTRTRINR